MGQVVYSVGVSLDGYSADAHGDFSWADPSEEYVDAVTEELAGVSTYLYGRRMYEAMAVWETDPAAAALSPASARFAPVWQAADKIVFSSTLDHPWTARTRVEPLFTAEIVHRAREEASGDLTVEGPTLAAAALRLGLVDRIELLVCPVVVGGGTRALPADLRMPLRLVGERRFPRGMVRLSYERG